MFCGNCGKKLEVTEKFCGSCGTAANKQSLDPTLDQNTTTRPMSKAERSTAANGKKIGNKIIGLVACGIILVGIIIVIFSFFSSGNPERILERYVSAVVNGDFRTVSRYSAIDFDALFQEIHESQGMSAREFRDELQGEFGVSSVEDLMTDILEEATAHIEREFGSDFDVSVEVIDSFTLGRRDREVIIDDLEWIFDSLGIDGSSVINLDRSMEIVEYEVEIIISGSRNEDIDTIPLLMLRDGRRSRVLDDNFIQELRWHLRW